MAESTRLPVVALVVALWYAANILVVISNKAILAHTGFSYPVFLTLSHMVACTILGLIASVRMPLMPLKSRSQAVKIVFLSVIFCTTIVLANASLQYIPVSFNQAIGATTPFFTAVLALMLQGAKEHIVTYASLVPVVAGIAIASNGEPMFHLLGFTLCLSATAGRALKTVVQSMLMTEPSEKLDPMSLLFYMCASCCVLLVPLVCHLEPTAWSEAVRIQSTNPRFWWYLFINAALAYFQNLLNFVVTKITSALTLQVLGNAKGVVAAAVSVLVFRNIVTAQGALGYLITVAGVVAYSQAKKAYKQDHGPGGPPGKGRSGGTPRESAVTSALLSEPVQHRTPRSTGQA